MGRLRRLAMAAGWSLVVCWLPMSIVYALLLQQRDGGDFGMYYAAAEALRFNPHSDLYHLQTLAETVLTHGGCGTPPIYPYPYQPLLALLLQPITLLPCQTALAAWLTFSFALWFCLSTIATRRVWRRYGARWAELIALMTFCFLPVLSGIGWGQVELVVLACLFAGMWLIHRDHEYLGGAVLGFGTVLKYFPAILVLYYLLRGRWRAAVGAAVITLALVAAELLVVGPQTLITSISAAQEDVRYYAAKEEGGHWMNALPGGPFIGYVAAIVFVAVVVWLRWGKRSQRANDLVGASWALPTMLMLSPLAWWYYFTWLLPAFVVGLEVTLQHARQPRAGGGWWLFISRWWPALALIVAYCLVDMIPFVMPQPKFLVTVLGTLLLWFLCGALYLHSAGVRLPSGFPSHIPVRRRSSALIMKGPG